MSPVVGALTRISDHCWVATSSFCQMNTVVVCGDGQAVVVDPGVTGPELAGLVEGLDRLGSTCAFGLSTHPHWDHLLWHPGFGQVPRLASADAASWLNAGQLAAAPAEAAPDAPGADLTLLGLVEPLDSGVIEWNGPQLELIIHDGHAPGHWGIVVPDDQVLIAGDMCSDAEVPLLDLAAASGDPLGDYLIGLDRLEEASRRCRVLVPGHGGLARGAAIGQRFEHDRAYLHGLGGATGVADERLDAALARGAGWLLEEHTRQQAWLAARFAGGGQPG